MLLSMGVDLKMSNYREQLIDRMIAIYGLESLLVRQFIELCENWDMNAFVDKQLEILVLAHEAEPQYDED